MYAGTKVNLHEILQPSTTSTVNETLPLFLCVFSADKGSENITDLTYNDFTAMYGKTADFFKYGQPLIQAHAILKAGGRVLGKRLVADDATLANLVIAAEVTQVEEQKVNEEGQPLYINEEGEETTDVTETPANVTYAKIKYSASTVENATTRAEVVAGAKKVMTGSVYPLFIIMDNGRGVSNKKVRIVPEYDISKTLSYMLYSIRDIEGTETVETKRFSVFPDAINNVNGVRKNMGLTKNTCTQFDAEAYSDGVDKFMAAVATITGYTVEDLYTYDILFGKTVKNESIPSIRIDSTGLNINATYGLELKSGTNGEFGDAPFPGEGAPIEAWTNAAVAYFGGEFSDEIYDLDQHKIDFCVDANYPDEVKDKIVELADFREDFYYFRDMGLNIYSLNDVQDKLAGDHYIQSPFAGDYMTCYDIIDNNSRKQVRVTMLHGLAPLLVDHYANNVAAPIAGEFNNFVISEAVENTLSFIPRITPKIDQKTILDDLKVNYANYSSNGLLVVQSTYTSQDHWGPLSYASNVIITQMCIKDIRRYCPRIRFMLMDDPDFTKYKQLIEDNVITNYKKFFKSIELVYTRDDEMIASKIFNASLYCYYKDFPQGEIFDVFAVEGSPDTNPVTSLTTTTV